MKIVLKFLASIGTFILAFLGLLFITILSRSLIYLLNNVLGDIIFSWNLENVSGLVETFLQLLRFILSLAYEVLANGVPMLLGVILYLLFRKFICYLFDQIDEFMSMNDMLMFICNGLLYLLPFIIFFVPNIISLGQGFTGMWQSTIFYSFKEIFVNLNGFFDKLIHELNPFGAIEVVLDFVINVILLIIMPFAIAFYLYMIMLDLSE